jgi:hypothetical protein
MLGDHDSDHYQDTKYMATTTQQRPIRKGAPPPANRKAPPNGAPKPDEGLIIDQDNGLFGLPPFTIVMHGIPGIGKTSMWAHLPDVGFIHDPQEQGIHNLVTFKRVPKPRMIEEAGNWQETRNLLADACTGKFKIKSLVLDSLTGFEKLCFHHHCHEQFEDNWSKDGFYAFQAGPKNAAKTDWPDILSDLDDVRRAGINVVVLGHSQVKTFSNPHGVNYDKYIPYLDKESWAQVCRWANAVFFYNQYVEVKKEGGKGKAQEDTIRRLIYTAPNPLYEAKNWWGMEEILNAGESSLDAYNAFCKAYKKAAGLR